MSKSGYNLWEVEKFCYLRYVGWVEIFGKWRKICKGKKRAIIKTLAPIYFLYIYIFGEYISARMIIYGKMCHKIWEFTWANICTHSHVAKLWISRICRVQSLCCQIWIFSLSLQFPHSNLTEITEILAHMGICWKLTYRVSW